MLKLNSLQSQVESEIPMHLCYIGIVNIYEQVASNVYCTSQRAWGIYYPAIMCLSTDANIPIEFNYYNSS